MGNHLGSNKINLEFNCLQKWTPADKIKKQTSFYGK